MRHRKDTRKLGRTSSHRRALSANMLKALVQEERIVTTVAKGKSLKREADKLITLAKKNNLAARRSVIAQLSIRYNPLTSKEKRRAKEGDTTAYNTDRKVIGKLFDTLGPRFAERAGGYTRLVRLGNRVGDNAQTCVLEFLSD